MTVALQFLVIRERHPVHRERAGGFNACDILPVTPMVSPQHPPVRLFGDLYSCGLETPALEVATLKRFC